MTQMVGGDMWVIKHTGKVSGDTLKGKVYLEGRQGTADLEGKRLKE